MTKLFLAVCYDIVLTCINYCRSYLIYAATLYVECGLIHCMPACLPCVCLQRCDKHCARGLNSTGRRGILGAYGLKSTSRCDSSARAHFASYCQNVVGTRTVQFCRTCASTLCRTIPQVYRGMGTLLFNVGHLL